MNPTKMTEIAQDVVRIAHDAGLAILDIYNNVTDIEITKKGDDSPLTIADKTANDIICKGLEALKEQFPIISEENKAVDYSTRKDYDYYWLVDPLDGTKEFIKRNGEFTVNIALVQDGRPVMGVVYAPVLEEMYWAVKDAGSFYSKNGVKKQLHAAKFNMKDEGLNIVASRSHLNEDTENFLAKLNKPEIVPQGSSLKFLIIAKGDAHIYPRLAPTMEWDTGAAQIVLEEAGGSVINHETKSALAYNKENLLNPHFVAYGNVTDSLS